MSETYYTESIPTSSNNPTLKRINIYSVSICGTQISIGIQKIYSWTMISVNPSLTIVINCETMPKYGNNSSPYTTTEQIQYKKNLDGTVRLWRFGPNSRFYYNGNEQQNPWRTPGQGAQDFG